MVKMHDTIVNSLYCGHCWDLESVSSLTSVRNSGSFFSVKRLLFVFAGDLAGVRYSGVSARRELTVTGSDCSSLSHKTLKSAIFKGFLGEGNLKCDLRVRISTF